MTTKWEIDPVMLKGFDVAIFGAAGSISDEAYASLSNHFTIACNRGFANAPTADMFVALDPCHHADVQDFGGVRVCGVDTDTVDALYAGMFYETVKVGGANLEIRNNVLAAMRIAQRAGAESVTLVCVDAPAYDKLHAHTGFSGFAEGLGKVTADLECDLIPVTHFAEDFNG